MTDLTIRTFDATRILPEEILRGLRGKMHGTLALPGEDGYEAARTIWNAMIDRRPAVVARCMGAADVIQTVKLARDAKLLLAVRGGGHNIAGNAVCHRVSIDLSLMKSVHVDPAPGPPRSARRDTGGFTRRRKVRSCNAYGYQFDDRRRRPALGGGLDGPRKFGLTIDNLISAEVITARRVGEQASRAPGSLLGFAGRRQFRHYASFGSAPPAELDSLSFSCIRRRAEPA